MSYNLAKCAAFVSYFVCLLIANWKMAHAVYWLGYRYLLRNRLRPQSSCQSPTLLIKLHNNPWQSCALLSGADKCNLLTQFIHYSDPMGQDCELDRNRRVRFSQPMYNRIMNGLIRSIIRKLLFVYFQVKNKRPINRVCESKKTANFVSIGKVIHFITTW